MPLPLTHPFSEVGPSTVAPGAFVRRGLVQWWTPNTYTRLNGTTWAAQIGNPFTINVTPGIATTPGGYNAIDVSAVSTSFSQASSITLTGAMTMDIWFLLSNTMTSGTTLLNEGSNATGTTSSSISLVYSATVGDRLRFVVSGTTFDTSFVGGVYRNQWHHMALVIPGTGTQTCVGYWNGTSNLSRSIGVTRPTQSFFSNSGGLRGMIGDMKVYSVALDASEVRQNYNALAPYYGRPTIV